MIVISSFGMMNKYAVVPAVTVTPLIAIDNVLIVAPLIGVTETTCPNLAVLYDTVIYVSSPAVDMLCVANVPVIVIFSIGIVKVYESTPLTNVMPVALKEIVSTVAPFVGTTSTVVPILAVFSTT